MNALTEVCILGGGTGTPKLLLGDNPPVDEVTVVANTADDVEFGDLFVSPDVDACLFAAAGRLDTDRWWGLADDTTAVASAIGRLTDELIGETNPRFRPANEQTAGRPIGRWRRFEPVPEFMTFGDEDRSIHRIRAAMLDRGHSLTAVTDRLGEFLGVPLSVRPMSDDPVATLIHTPEGTLHFQEYWVHRRGNVEIDSIEFRGSETAEPTDEVLAALSRSTVVIGPSNPVTSLGPILDLPGVKPALEAATVIAVSPFLGAEAFSGPAADLMAATGLPVGPVGLERAYPFLDGIVIDEDDPTEVDIASVRTDIKIDTPPDASRVWEALDRLTGRLD